MYVRNMMLKTGKRLLWIIGFCVTFGLAFGRIDDILHYKVKEDDTVAAFMKETKDTVDVLYVGTSKAYRAISPMRIWEQAGITGYVLGTPSQCIASSYYLIKEGIKRQHPAVVAMEVYGASYGSWYASQERLHLSIDNIPFDNVRMELIREFLPRAISDPIIRLEFIFPFVKYHTRWNELSENDFHNTRSYLKGFAASFHVAEKEEPRQYMEEGKLFEGTEEYLNRIIDLCQEEGIKLIFFRAPSCEDKGYKAAIMKGNRMLAIAQSRGVETLDFENMRAEIGLDYENDFMDSKHLNIFGAYKISDYFSKYLKTECSLTGHIGDAAFSEWDSDLSEYKTRMAQKTSGEAADIYF